jgi:hypothetical protein
MHLKNRKKLIHSRKISNFTVLINIYFEFLKNGILKIINFNILPTVSFYLLKFQV